MKQLDNTRDKILAASRAYYSHRAYYEDILVQEEHRFTEATKRELKFLEYAFSAHATRPIKKVLDVACGSGRHVLGLTKLGYECTGLDYTPERIKIANERAKREGLQVKLLQGDATLLEYESEFDAVLALYILFLLPSDEDVLEALKRGYRSLRKGGVLVCNIGNPLYPGESWFSLQTIYKGLTVVEAQTKGIHSTEVAQLSNFDPIRGVAWWQETSTIETPEGIHVFRDRERLRLFTYWDLLHYLEAAGFKKIKCYPGWETEPRRKPKAERLVFIALKE